MKHDVNDEVPNGTLKILVFSNGVPESNGRLKGNHATHF
jgi:hypothetical protein